ncbi:acyl-CoA desaturase [Gramella sp. AN32]|uniref:Fatty acid desaturase family protein n=1 Tax=Christiangramia antarctica TaxID=2058158 RepID=A0ABW5XAJ8_9FLAO|nr:acyl-CoA desaturase [Gramella sp. AN32]
MKLKTALMLSLFLIPLTTLSLGIINSTGMLFTLYILSGFGMAGIGMGVMHDAIHGSYSKSSKLNKILGYTMNLIGANATVWKLQHNVLHHTYTNIQESDDDINMPFFLRFSPHAKKYKIHKFQFIYVWFFYSISTIAWITMKDFVRLFRYRNMGMIPSKAEFRDSLIKLIFWKILYYTYALILPAVFLPFSFGLVLLAFLSMHIVTGLVISCVFQVAHIMPGIEYPTSNEEGEIENNWLVHQLLTTSNFSPKSKLFSWLIGGLNYQIEHHLFPNICHVHYRHISPIVKDIALQYGIAYNEKSTFVEALGDHLKMLKTLGK